MPIFLVPNARRAEGLCFIFSHGKAPIAFVCFLAMTLALGGLLLADSRAATQTPPVQKLVMSVRPWLGGGLGRGGRSGGEASLPRVPGWPVRSSVKNAGYLPIYPDFDPTTPYKVRTLR